MEEKNVPVVEVNDLVVHYETYDGVVEAVNGVSFKIEKRDVLGLVGETGAGKTTIALSLMQLLPPGLTRRSWRRRCGNTGAKRSA